MSAPLLLLPLDDRPINLEYPPLLAAVAGESLLLPPREALGHFLTPGNPAALADWLLQATPQARALIVSLDMLAYGGLVASRNPLVAVDEALRRLEVLREVKARCPDLRILAFNVIMRLTITGVDAETRAAWRDIFRYSVLRDQAERLGDTAAAAELAQVIARIPPRLLQAYLEARARNHAVNRAALELLGDGVLDFLALVQEDTAPTGLHIAEQASLQALARERVAGDRWRLYPGTDEAALTLLARYLVQERRVPFPVAIHLRDAEAAQHPALFEDLPLVEAVRRHLDVVGGVEDATGRPFAVHTFTPPQPDLFEMPPLEMPTWDVALRTFPANDVAQWLASWGTLLPGVWPTRHIATAATRICWTRCWPMDATGRWTRMLGGIPRAIHWVPRSPMPRCAPVPARGASRRRWRRRMSGRYSCGCSMMGCINPSSAPGRCGVQRNPGSPR